MALSSGRLRRPSVIGGGRWDARGWPALLAVGFYAWLTTASFGIVVLDIVYARLVPGEATAFSEVADFLLLVNAMTGFAALGAIALVWNSRVARTLLVTSVLVVGLGFLAHPVLAAVLAEGSSLGAGLRLLFAGAVSMLAFAAFALVRTDL